MEELPYALASLPLSSLGLLKVHALCRMGDVLLKLREYMRSLLYRHSNPLPVVSVEHCLPGRC